MLLLEKSSCVVIFLLFTFFPSIPAPIANGFYPRTRYNETEARQLINLSAGAYSTSPQGCINITFGNSAYLYTLFSSNNLVCDIAKSSCASYILVNDQQQRVYVVFRGTKTDQQLLLEGWQSLAPKVNFFNAGSANKYFADALDVLWPNVQQVFTNPRFQNYDFTFTGHSLGAALAALAALKTVVTGLRPDGSRIHLVTFGEPRVGNIVLAQKFDQILPYAFRVVHADDIVPHLPKCAKDNMTKNAMGSRACSTTNLIEGYHHGIEIWYPGQMGFQDIYYECLGTPKNEDFACSDSLVFKADQYKKYIASHRYYFEHKVPPYGESGCTQDFPMNGQTNDETENPLIAAGFKLLLNS
uniref:Fungal lipase-like domain-containing protein n=1 Tax=Panagrolaimus davidi TaxID=227884 RepID=A0A914QP68_9BILA